jgi:hypothetical protein
MTSFFPDLNVWLAMSARKHQHSKAAWSWMELQSEDARLLFSRVTQVGLLRLLTSPPVMGSDVLTLREAWQVYDRWLDDHRVAFHPEPRGVDKAFREATMPLGSHPASKLVGDCYLLAYAKTCDATLITFDKALANYARKQGCASILPG